MSRRFKLLLIGSSGVGKTALLDRFADGTFRATYISTISLDFKRRTIFLDGIESSVMVWDRPGNDRFRSITSSEYRGAQAILIVFDLTDRESFTGVRNWRNEVDRYADEDVLVLLVGCKSDGARDVSLEEAMQCAMEMNCDYMETSAKTGVNCMETFYLAAAKLNMRPVGPPARDAMTRLYPPSIPAKDTSPDIIRGLSVNPPTVSLCENQVLTVSWTGSNFDANSSKYFFQLQKKLASATASPFFQWAVWEDLGVVFQDNFALGNEAYRAQSVMVRVRASLCGGRTVAVMSDPANYRGFIWSSWSSPALVDMAQLTGFTVPVVERSRESHVDWRPHWTPDAQCVACEECKKPFSLLTRRHHCRSCGRCICGVCAPKVQLAYVETYGRLARLCIACCRERHIAAIVKQVRLSPPSPVFAAVAYQYLSTVPELTVLNPNAKAWAEGATSMVYAAIFNGIPVAIKQYNANFVENIVFVESRADLSSGQMSVGTESFNQVDMEIFVYTITIDCQYALKMLTSRSREVTLYPFIATEMIATHGTLLHVLTNRSNLLPWLWRIEALIQVAMFLEYIHSRGIAHMDLKAENIIVVSLDMPATGQMGCVVKVFDFNSCALFGEKPHVLLSRLGRTSTHAAPEVIRLMAKGNEHKTFSIDDKYDIFSFGVLVAEVAARALTYSADHELTTIGSIEAAVLAGHRPFLRSSHQQLPIPDGLESLVQRCWDQNPAIRPTASVLIGSLKAIRSSLLPVASSFAVSQVSSAVSDLTGPANPTRTSSVAHIDHTSKYPKYLVVLKHKRFAKPKVFGDHSDAEKCELALPGLKAYPPDHADLNVLRPIGAHHTTFEMKQIYQQHPGKHTTYIPLEQFADEMKREKQLEFKEIMCDLGAKEIRIVSSDSQRHQTEMQASIAGPSVDLTVQGSKSTSTSSTSLGEWTYGIPPHAKPMFREKRRIFYEHEPDWIATVASRKDGPTMLTARVAFTFSSQHAVSAKVMAKLHELGGIGLGGSKTKEQHFSYDYQISFFCAEDYRQRNREHVAKWSTTIVQAFLDHHSLWHCKLRFAENGITGSVLLDTSNLVQLLRSVGCDGSDIAKVQDAVEAQLAGLSTFGMQALIV